MGYCQSNANYVVGNEINNSTEVLKSNIWDNNDAYILVRGNITTIGDNGKQVAFKNYSPFIMCIPKIDGTAINDAEDLDLVMLIYNFLENSSNYSETIGSLWFYSKDEATNFDVNIAKPNANQNDRILKNATITVSSKNPSKISGWLKIQLINCKLINLPETVLFAEKCANKES